MLLQYATGEPFASGATVYAYRPATDREDTPRITIDILIGDLRTSGFVDTGGVYLVCPPHVAASLNLDPDEGLPAQQLLLRGAHLQGMLHRIPLTILATEGESITIEATAFVPRQQIDWSNFPCILGMHSCLERLRFAVDPGQDMFYFGELS